MNFQVDFGAEDEGRLTPFEDDKPKYAENSMLQASSVLITQADSRVRFGKSKKAYNRRKISCKDIFHPI